MNGPNTRSCSHGRWALLGKAELSNEKCDEVCESGSQGAAGTCNEGPDWYGVKEDGLEEGVSPGEVGGLSRP